MTTTEKRVIVQFGILDWEQCLERFGTRPASDVYVDAKFPQRAIWYLAQGAYKMYHTFVQESASQLTMCDSVWYAQGNNEFSEKAAPMERSFSMGDIVVMSNGTVWLCTKGWLCLNPDVI